MTVPVHVILVPQGAEYQSVCRGLKTANQPPTVLSLPIGCPSVSRQLAVWEQAGHFAERPNILLMGLCGGLNASYGVGDVVLYDESVVISPALQTLGCDRPLTAHIQARLGDRVAGVTALTSDRVICTAAEKRSLSSYADVVDMEGIAVLEFFHQGNYAVATLRVVSDDCHHDIPDLTTAVAADGSLRPLPLTLALLRQPLAATRFVRGSLRGLKVLQQVTRDLFAI